MGKLSLELSACLENVSVLKVMDDDFRWYLKLKCSNCGEETSSWQYICLSESTETKGGRGSASMVQKCKLCGRENHLNILKDSIKPYLSEDDGNFKSIIKFESRGLDVVGWDIRSGWVVLSSCSRTKFSDVDLSEYEWYEYDEDANESISITEVKYQLLKLKK